MKPLRLAIRSLLLIPLSLTGCGDTGSPATRPAAAAAQAGGAVAARQPQAPPSGDAATDFAGCTRGTLEPDFESAPLAGPAVREGALPPGQYLISSTYLQLRPAQGARFQQLLGPVMADLSSRAGLLAIALGNAPSCSVARTLTVWRDDAAMLEFVIGEAHSAAMSAVGELSRGASSVTHWSGDQDSVNWRSAAEQLRADDGPLY